MIAGGEIYLGLNWFGSNAGGGVIQNDSGATFDIQTAWTIYNNTGNNSVVNAGLLEQTATTGTSTVQVGVANTGVISVQTGTLDLASVAATGAGSFTVANGATLEVGGGSSSASAFTVANGAILQVGGGFAVSGGTLNLAGALVLTIGGATFAGATVDVGASTSVTGGVADFSGATITSLGNDVSVSGGALELGGNSVAAASLEQNGGLIDGSGILTVTGAATFGYEYEFSAVQTGSGTTLLKGATTLSSFYSGYGDLYLDGGRIIENAGTFTWLSGQIYLGYNPDGDVVGGATIKNDSGATFDIQTSATVYIDLGPTSFINAGTLEQTVTTGTSLIQVGVVNTGAISVQTGTLDLAGGGSSSAAALTVAANATLEFGGGTFTMNGGSYNVAGATEIGDGEADFSAASSVKFAGGLTLTGGQLELSANNASAASYYASGGNLDGTGAFTVSGPAYLDGDAETGAGTTILSGATLQSGDDDLDGGRTLENTGVDYWQGGTLNLGYFPSGTTVGGATFTNAAGATLVSNTANVTLAGVVGTTTFNNAGTWQIGSGPVATVTTTNFVNTGTVAIADLGELNLGASNGSQRLRLRHPRQQFLSDRQRFGGRRPDRRFRIGRARHTPTQRARDLRQHDLRLRNRRFHRPRRLLLQWRNRRAGRLQPRRLGRRQAQLHPCARQPHPRRDLRGQQRRRGRV